MANQYTKLFINNQEIDLFDSEELPLNVTRRVNNIEGQVQGDYSRASITVPATKNNINILGESRQFFSFRIEVDGAPSWNGVTQVKKAETFSQSYGAIKKNYELNLISNNSSWFVLLGETLLSEVTNEVVEYSEINISTGFLSEPSLRNWCFMLIKFKEWENKSGQYYTPSYFESTPALFIKPLVIEAFNSIGYSIISDFFETDLFSKLALPTPVAEKFPEAYNAEYLNTSVSLSSPYTGVSLAGFNFPFDVIDVAAPQIPTVYDNVINFEYTVPLTGYYEVTIEATLSATPPPPGAYVVILAISPTPPGSQAVGFGYTNFGGGGVPYPGAVTNKASTGLFLQEGDTIHCAAQVSSGLTVDSASMKIVGEAVVVEDSPIDFKYLLRDWKFLDMLKGLICMFNLCFETDDDARTVTIEPKDQYVNTERLTATTELKEGFYKKDIIDYSKKVDYSKTGNINFPSFAGRYDFLYNSDNEETIDWIEKTEVFKVYESRFPLSSGDNSKEEKKTVPFFVKTIHVTDIEARYPDTTVTPQFPLIYPQNYVLDPTADEAEKDISPRILYFGGQRGGIDGYIEINETGAQTELPAAFMVNNNDTTALDPNLGFNNIVLNGLESVGLMQRYYLQDLVRKDKGKVRENYVFFNSIDELNFQFRIKGIIDSQKYIIQEIEGYNPLKDSPTNFKFYLDVVPSAEDAAKVVNSPLKNVVSFLTE
jgi:hypothetical protein